MKTAKQQTYYLDGAVYRYRITKAALLRYEQQSGRKISFAMPILQIIRALYHVSLQLLRNSCAKHLF